MSKGIFIPDITVEMIRKVPLEAIEALLVEGEMYDVDMPKWTPCSERLPEAESKTLVTTDWGDEDRTVEYAFYWDNQLKWGPITKHVVAWMLAPIPWKGKI